MKKLIFIAFLSIISSTILAQDFIVPKDYKMTVKEDYNQYEPQILKAIDWALKTPLNIEPKKREETYAFILTWMTGTPSVSLNINLDIVHISKTNADLLFPFMMGWTKFALENNYSKDDLLGTEAGIETAVKFYQDNKSFMKKDKEIEKFQKLIEKGKLKVELEKRFNKK